MFYFLVRKITKNLIKISVQIQLMFLVVYLNFYENIQIKRRVVRIFYAEIDKF